LAISPRQIDRRLAPHRRLLTKRLYGRTKPGSVLKHHIPVKTDRWDVTTAGFTEIDLVAHCGSFGDGEFVHSLNLTDIHTTWVETAAPSRPFPAPPFRGHHAPSPAHRSPAGAAGTVIRADTHVVKISREALRASKGL